VGRGKNPRSPSNSREQKALGAPPLLTRPSFRCNPGRLQDRHWSDGRACRALDLERLHDKGEFAEVLGNQLVELQVLQQMERDGFVWARSNPGLRSFAMAARGNRGLRACSATHSSTPTARQRAMSL